MPPLKLTPRDRYLLHLRLSPLPCTTTGEQEQISRLWAGCGLEEVDQVMQAAPNRNWGPHDWPTEPEADHQLTLGDLRVLREFLEPAPMRPLSFALGRWLQPIRAAIEKVRELTS